jgi:hypothetical protein
MFFAKRWFLVSSNKADVGAIITCRMSVSLISAWLLLVPFQHSGCQYHYSNMMDGGVSFNRLGVRTISKWRKLATFYMAIYALLTWVV